MMDLLGIKELRPAASHDPNSPNAVNYDESKADVYPDAARSADAEERQAGDLGQDVVERSGGRRLWRISIARFWAACRRMCPR